MCIVSGNAVSESHKWEEEGAWQETHRVEEIEKKYVY